MTKRIFSSICVVALTVFIASLVLIMGAMYSYSTANRIEQMKIETQLAAKGVENDGLDFFDGLESEDYRLTWIAPDGSVLYDSSSDAGEMENHLDREEVQQALKEGTGVSKRYSKTLTEQMLYCAERLTDGSVLRIADSQYSVLTIVAGLSQTLIIIAVAALALAFLMASRLSKKIVEPLNAIDLDSPAVPEAYDEIKPLIRRIESQQQRLRSQTQQLQRRRDEFEAATRNMAEGIVLLNAGGEIMSVNTAAMQILSLKSGSVGRKLLEINGSSRMRELVQSAQSGHHSQTELEISGLGYQINASPVFSEDAVSGIVLLIFDVTEKERAERMRREFTANVSHELKTPLHSISGYAELMISGMAKPEDVPKFAGRIYTEAQRLITLVSDIIRLSHLDEGSEGFQKSETDLYSIAQTTVRSLESEAQEAQVSLVLEGESAPMLGVPELLGGIVYNLAENAIKYNKKYGSVSVRVENSGSEAVLTVSDTGIGIPEEEQERIFERFYRVDKSHSKEVGGTGLGLSIVKHSVQLHNAKLELKSTPGAGTTVTVRFPK